MSSLRSFNGWKEVVIQLEMISAGNGTMYVDIVGEVSKYEWDHAKWLPEKMIAASPFRYDRSPSFFLNLSGEYAGTWKDSGAYDADYESGNFPKLLAFLRDETYDETVDYLEELYGIQEEDTSGNVRIPSIKLKPPSQRIELTSVVMKEYAFRHPYLSRRHITEKVQRFMGVGYDKRSNAVAIPWRHADGVFANIKFRKVKGKTFWYRKGAAPIRSLVYGIDKVYKHDLRKVAACEAEIDAMSWYVCGVPAIALGGTTITQEQLDLIRKSPIDTLIIAKDNDAAGKKLSERMRVTLRGYVRVIEIEIPADYKDANDALVAGIDLEELIPK